MGLYLVFLLRGRVSVGLIDGDLRARVFAIGVVWRGRGGLVSDALFSYCLVRLGVDRVQGVFGCGVVVLDVGEIEDSDRVMLCILGIE